MESRTVLSALVSIDADGLLTVDVGSPLLGMHSCRELGPAQDVPLMVRALTACLEVG